MDAELSVIHNRLHKVIPLTFPELEQIFTTKSDLFLNFVQLFPHPDLIQNLSKIIITHRIRTISQKNISTRIAEQKVIETPEVSKRSYSAVDSDDVLCEQLKIYTKHFQGLLGQKEQCINVMVDIVKQRTEYDIILSLPGIRPNTAVRLMAEIVGMPRFTSYKQLNAYAGIDWKNIF